jgi:hypothetical protein
VDGTEFGPVWVVTIASVETVLRSEVDLRVTAGMRTLKDVEPVSTVSCVVTVTSRFPCESSGFAILQSV